MLNNNNNTNGKKGEQDPYAQYRCGKCGGLISSSRPPTYIAQNCSCSDLAAFASGGGTELNFAHNKQFTYDHTTPFVYHQPESFTTDKSAPNPEGIETTEPNLETGNSWEPMRLTSQTPGLNEVHQYRYSDLPFAVERWLGSEMQDSQPCYDTRRSAHSNQYLVQTNHIQAPTTQKKSNKSKQSAQSAKSGETMVDSWTREADPVTGTGGWVQSDGDYFEATHGSQEGEGYPYATEISGSF